jgi:hypothetical protein
LIARLLDGLEYAVHQQSLVKGLLDELMLRFKQCEIRDMAYLGEPVAFVPDSKDVQIGCNSLVAHFLVRLLCCQSELPTILFFGRVQRILQLLGRGILIGSAIAKNMLGQLVQADCLPPRLTLKSREVGEELRFFRIEMGLDAITFPIQYTECQARLFELCWLLKASVQG